MGLELREPLHQELVGNPMQHCLPIQGDSVCASKAQDEAKSETCELCGSLQMQSVGVCACPQHRE